MVTISGVVLSSVAFQILNLLQHIDSQTSLLVMSRFPRLSVECLAGPPFPVDHPVFTP